MAAPHPFTVDIYFDNELPTIETILKAFWTELSLKPHIAIERLSKHADQSGSREIIHYALYLAENPLDVLVCLGGNY